MSNVPENDAQWLPAAMQGRLSVDELVTDPLWPALSSGARRMLLARATAGRATPAGGPARRDDDVPGTPSGVPASSGDGEDVPHAEALVPAGPVWRAAQAPPNVLVNNPGEDTGSGHTTQSEPSLAVRLPNIVVGFIDTANLGNQAGVARSDSSGALFTDEATLADVSTNGDCVLTADNAGDFFFAFLGEDSKGHSSIAVARSADGGATFGRAVQASVSSNSPQVVQDKDWITADVTGTATDGNLYVAWTSLDTAARTAEIQFSRSADHGITWSRAMRLSDMGPALGHHGAMPAVAPDGTLYVAWTNRDTGAILIARSDDGGLNFTDPVTGKNPATGGRPVATITQVGTPSENDKSTRELNGGIRANSFVSIAVGPNGTVYLAVAAAPEGSDNAKPVDNADVLLMRSTDRGKTWSTPPMRINDDTTSNDQWMPSVAVTSHGVVGVMFYDRRNDPKNLAIDVYLALSWNDAATFTPAQRITTTSFPPVAGVEEGIKKEYMGDYNHMVAAGTELFMVWGDNREKVGDHPDPNVFFAALEPRPVPQQAWLGDFTGSGRAEVLFWAADGNWWLGTYGNGTLNWFFAGNPGWTSLNDGQHLNWLGDFTGSGRAEVLFWAADGNWWLGSYTGTELTWSFVGNPGWTSLNDGQHLNWLGDFTGSGRAEVLFWAADGNWWLGSYTGTELTWSFVGNPGWTSLNDGQHLNWLGDFTGSGRAE